MEKIWGEPEPCCVGDTGACQQPPMSTGAGSVTSYSQGAELILTQHFLCAGHHDKLPHHSSVGRYFWVATFNRWWTDGPKVNQSWIFIGRTDAEAETAILWPSDVKSWLTGKDCDTGKHWRQEEKGATEEDEMVGWYYWLNGHEFEQAPGEGFFLRPQNVIFKIQFKKSQYNTEWGKILYVKSGTS